MSFGLTNAGGSLGDRISAYTVAGALAELVEGETLGEALGKIAKGIAELIAHLKDTNNPHEVKASDIGAAQLKKFPTVTVNLSDWSQAGDYWYAAKSVEEMRADLSPQHMDIVRGSDPAADDLMDEAFQLIRQVTTSAGQCRFRAVEKPEVAIKIRMEVVS